MLHTESKLTATINVQEAHGVDGFFLIAPPAVVKPGAVIRVAVGFVCKDKGQACDLTGKNVHWELKMGRAIAWAQDVKLFAWDTTSFPATPSYTTFADVLLPENIAAYKLTITFPAQEIA